MLPGLRAALVDAFCCLRSHHAANRGGSPLPAARDRHACGVSWSAVALHVWPAACMSNAPVRGQRVRRDHTPDVAPSVVALRDALTGAGRDQATFVPFRARQHVSAERARRVARALGRRLEHQAPAPTGSAVAEGGECCGLGPTAPGDCPHAEPSPANCRSVGGVRSRLAPSSFMNASPCLSIRRSRAEGTVWKCTTGAGHPAAAGL